MIRFRSFLFFLSFTFSCVYSQNDSVSIIQCFKDARENAALKPQLDIMSAISDLKIENASSTNLPALSAYGKAWYQNEAMKVSLPLPVNPVSIDVNQFQYNIGLEVDQKIYDGGMARKSRQTESAAEISNLNKVETDLYKLNDRVVSYFFNTLFFNENRKILELKSNVLQKRLEEMESGVKNGIIKK
jgi:outer membrane protein TolC